MKEVWGCEKPAQAIVWVDGEDFYYNCPLKFIPNEVLNWYDEYSYNLKFLGTAKRFLEQSFKFLQAVFFYEEQLAEAKRMNEPNRNNTSTKLKAGFNGRRNKS